MTIQQSATHGILKNPKTDSEKRHLIYEPNYDRSDNEESIVWTPKGMTVDWIHDSVQIYKQKTIMKSKEQNEEIQAKYLENMNQED